MSTLRFAGSFDAQELPNGRWIASGTCDETGTHAYAVAASAWDAVGAVAVYTWAFDEYSESGAACSQDRERALTFYRSRNGLTDPGLDAGFDGHRVPLEYMDDE